MKEQTIQKKIINAARARGAVVYNITAAYPNGCPDLLICYQGRFIGLEIKKPGCVKNTTELQRYNIDRIKKAGGFSAVLTCVQDLEIILDSVQSE